jgi:hypothetical protein
MLITPSQIILTVFLTGYIFVYVRVNPWATRRKDRLRNPIAICAWALLMPTIGSILVAVWSESARAWFGHALDVIARRLLR